MTPLWSAMLALLAALTFATTRIEAASSSGIALRALGTPSEVEPAARAGTLRRADIGETAAQMIEAVRHLWARLRVWLEAGYKRAPAMMLGLAVLVSIPLLMLVGSLMRYKPEPEDATRRVARPASSSSPSDAKDTPPPATQVERRARARAFVEIEGLPATRRTIAGELFRIGREDDNDLCLDDRTVHRYHAAITRESGGTFRILDVSGDDGNGMLVNSVRVRDEQLRDGDRIELGASVVHFHLESQRPVDA